MGKFLLMMEKEQWYSKDGDILLRYSHKQGDKIIGAMHWSRYYKNEIGANIKFLNK